jgi:RND family efflux transporter MFP subunit
VRLDRDTPRRVRRRPRGLSLGLSVATVAALLVLLAGDALPVRRPAVTVVPTRAMETGAGGAGGAPVLSASGYVVARIRASVAPEITGRLVELRVDVGSRVRRGELLGRLADEDLVARAAEAEATIASSEAALAEAITVARDLRREAGRQRDLLAQALTSQARHDAALAAADAAEARAKTAEGRLGTTRAGLEVARAQLEKMRIRAPFDGTVLEKNAELGEVVGPSFAASMSGGGAPVVTLADLASVEVEVDVNEAYIQRVTPGMPARITLDAYPDREYAGSCVRSSRRRIRRRPYW